MTVTVGFIGLGKLGLPCALAIEAAGYTVLGVDPSPQVADILESRTLPYRERGAQELLDTTRIQLVTMRELIARCDMVFVAVQTPHQPLYEGVTPMPEQRADFDYSFLIEAVKDAAHWSTHLRKAMPFTIISTVLPGTVEREIEPLLASTSFLQLCYNPFFIAMGTTINDFMNPEFVLLGTHNDFAGRKVEAFYRTLHNRPIRRMSIVDAELTKVAYNTFISTKLAFVNTLQEICERCGGNVDNVTEALCSATDRLISPKYMRAGMGDGGGCHPRDNIALSWFAKTQGLSHDLFEDVMKAREGHAEWLASLIAELHERLPVVLCGAAFKKDTNLTVGSPAFLVSYYLTKLHVPHTISDPHVNDTPVPSTPACFFISTEHDCWHTAPWPDGSIIIDPWRLYEHTVPTTCSYIPIGKPHSRALAYAKSLESGAQKSHIAD